MTKRRKAEDYPEYFDLFVYGGDVGAWLDFRASIPLAERPEPTMLYEASQDFRSAVHALLEPFAPVLLWLTRRLERLGR